MAAAASLLMLSTGAWMHERRGRTEAALAAASTGIAGLFAATVVAGPVYALVPALAAHRARARRRRPWPPRSRCAGRPRAWPGSASWAPSPPPLLVGAAAIRRRHRADARGLLRGRRGAAVAALARAGRRRLPRRRAQLALWLVAGAATAAPRSSRRSRCSASSALSAPPASSGTPGPPSCASRPTSCSRSTRSRWPGWARIGLEFADRTSGSRRWPLAHLAAALVARRSRARDARARARRRRTGDRARRRRLRDRRRRAPARARVGRRRRGLLRARPRRSPPSDSPWRSRASAVTCCSRPRRR